MVKKSVFYFKKIMKYWFIILIIMIIIISIYNLNLAIWITVIVIIIYLITFLPDIIFSIKLKKLLKTQLCIDDKTMAKKLKKPLNKIQEKMYQIHKKQVKKDWLIIFLNKHYIYYNEKIIQIFKKYYKNGLGEKEILEKLKRYNVNTRAEIKLMADTLIKMKKLDKRNVSVQEYRDKKRYG
ncbi:MAG: hypothetical protein ACTSUX_09610 [Promethearchaeota archaeon]